MSSRIYNSISSRSLSGWVDIVGNVSEMTNRRRGDTSELNLVSLGCWQSLVQCGCVCACVRVSVPNVQAYGHPVTVEMPLTLQGPESLYCVPLSFGEALMALPVSTIMLLVLSSWWHCTMKDGDYSSNVQERWGRLSRHRYLYTTVT